MSPEKLIEAKANEIVLPFLKMEPLNIAGVQGIFINKEDLHLLITTCVRAGWNLAIDEIKLRTNV